MQLKSLAYQTDLIFPEFDGEVIDRGNYRVIVTPTNPAFYWGNFLLFAQPPGSGDFLLWKQIFAEEIGYRPRIRHMAFGWDSPEGHLGDVEPFLQAGFRLFQNVVLTTPGVHQPPRYNPDIVVKTLDSDSEWAQALQNHLINHTPEEDHGPDFVSFATKEMERYRAMTQAGLGAWFGAFVGDRLAGGLGLFVKGSIGRFQEVGTHPDFRRQGICRSLVYRAACYAFERMGAKRLVMVADEDYTAARIYEQVGFRPVERQVGIDWRP